ncbi:hypothetical protein JK364_36210 [Streptomyces sp. 110]|uniref:Uncharacterized protein n=1 Tax=Streptomyces endocoffeicus TaxID=2898945 RepID=A0ABS1PZC6_9ACTN|nr:hypothetical protein [Streptomyces endocoffeicus]MBL1117785.1 hypothetical protein [Streptomyces endocoffeicus]
MVTDPTDPAENDGQRRHGLEKHEAAPLPQRPGNTEAAEPMTSWHATVPKHEPTNGSRPTPTNGSGPTPANGSRPTPTHGSSAQPSGEPSHTPNGPSFPVLPTSEYDKLTRRLRYAVSGFVDSPHGAVEEADALLVEVATRLTDLLAERRATLRAAWHEDDAVISETEELRLAMRGYRNVLERLISI